MSRVALQVDDVLLGQVVKRDLTKIDCARTTTGGELWFQRCGAGGHCGFDGESAPGHGGVHVPGDSQAAAGEVQECLSFCAAGGGDDPGVADHVADRELPAA